MSRILRFAIPLFVVLGLAPAFHTAVAQGALPLDEFANSDELGSMKLSPSGEFLAFLSGQRGGDLIRVLDLSSYKTTTVADAPGGFRISNFHWVSNSRIVFEYAERNAPSSTPREINAVDLDGSNLITLQDHRVGPRTSTGTIMPMRDPTQTVLDIISPLDPSDSSVLVALVPIRVDRSAASMTIRVDARANPELARLDTFSGTLDRMSEAPFADARVILDDNSQARFALGTNSAGQLAVAWKRTAESDWESFALAGYRDASVKVHGFEPDGRTLLMTATPVDQQFSVLLRLDPAQRSATHVLGIPSTNVDEVLIDAKSNEVVGLVGQRDGTPVYQWLKPQNAFLDAQHEFVRLFNAHAVRFVSQSRDGRRLLAIVESDSASDLFALFEVGTKTAVVLGKRLPPLDLFTRSDQVRAMKISPDGEYIAFTSSKDDQDFLTFLKLGSSDTRDSIHAPFGCLIHEFHWASNSRIVFTLAGHPIGDLPPTPTGEIFAVDRDGGNRLKVYGYAPEPLRIATILPKRRPTYASAEIVSLLEGDDRNILITERPWKAKGSAQIFDPDAQPWLTRLDIYTGKTSRIERVPLPNATIMVDRHDRPRFAIGAGDGTELPVMWRRTANADWDTFALPGFRSGTVLPLQFTADDRAILFSAMSEGGQLPSLFRLDLADLAIKELIAAPNAELDELVNDFTSRETIGVSTYGEKLGYHWILPDHPAAQLKRALLRTFDGNEVRFTSSSADGRRAIVSVQSDVVPGEYLLLDTHTKQADAIITKRPWIDARRMRKQEPISITARDGLVLHGYLTRPLGDGPHPLVVRPHGMPLGFRDTWGFNPEVQLLASRGYAVLQVNYRGSAGYGLDFVKAGFREWGTKMQDDLTDAVRWAIEQKIAASDRLCIFGTGLGAYAALMSTAREPNLYRCAIGLEGIYDLEMMYKNANRTESQAQAETLELVLGEDLRERSPIHRAGDIKASVLLIQEDETGRAGYEQAVRMKHALERNNKAVEWESLRYQRHRLVMPHGEGARRRIYESVLSFLDKHLAEVPAAGT